jgi:dihydroorotate dehydrogenase (fumarate)
MVDLKTTYLGLELKNPLVAAASPISEKVDRVRRLEDNGISAVVMYSLFEEQIIHERLELDHFLSQSTNTFAEAATFLPDMGRYNIGADAYIERLHRLKKAVSIPVIGSLNGVSSGGWTEYAQRIEAAGADALELNLYFLPTDPALTSAEIEENSITLVREVRGRIKIPIAVKLSPFYTALPNFARRIVAAGANALVLFNRFYQPDFDLEEFKVIHNLELSNSYEMRLPLRWVALLYGHIQADFALTTGVHTPTDVVKSIMAGANVTMIASELLKHGATRIPELLAGVQSWMEENEYESIQQMRGAMSKNAVAEPAALERANYMKVLSSWKQLP